MDILLQLIIAVGISFCTVMFVELCRKPDKQDAPNKEYMKFIKRYKIAEQEKALKRMSQQIDEYDDRLRKLIEDNK